MLFFHDCCDFGVPVPLFCFICCCSSKPLGPQKSAALGAGITAMAAVTTIKREYSRKNRRFQLRSLHTMHAFPCIPITKDAKNYCLQDCLGDLVLLFHGCCDFGLPVPLFCFISWCSSKLLGPQKSAALGAGITASHHHHPTI